MQLQGAKIRVVFCTGPVGIVPAEGLMDIPMQLACDEGFVGDMGMKSLACIFCSAISASLKLGGVAGVFVGAI